MIYTKVVTFFMAKRNVSLPKRAVKHASWSLLFWCQLYIITRMAMTMCVKFQMLRICLFTSRVEPLLKDPFFLSYSTSRVLLSSHNGSSFPESCELKKTCDTWDL